MPRLELVQLGFDLRGLRVIEVGIAVQVQISQLWRLVVGNFYCAASLQGHCQRQQADNSDQA